MTTPHSYTNNGYNIVSMGKQVNDTTNAIIWQLPDNSFLEFQAHPAVCMAVCAHDPKTTQDLLEICIMIVQKQRMAAAMQKAFYRFTFYRNGIEHTIGLDAKFTVKRSFCPNVDLAMKAHQKYGNNTELDLNVF